MLGTQALDIAKHGILGPLSPEIDGVYLLNAGGVHLVNMRPWRWLRRPISTLSLVSGQNYIALPSNFLQFDGSRPIWLTSGLGEVRLVSMDEILDARTATVARVSTWWDVSLGYDTATVPQPRLELDRTPSASQSAFFTYSYRATWGALSSTEAVLPIPVWIENLYIEIVRECARALTDDQTPNVRLDRIKASTVYQDAERTDSLGQANLGQMRGQVRYGQGIGFDYVPISPVQIL